jgi:hypothetical protein
LRTFVDYIAKSDDVMMSVWPLVANPKSIYSDSVMPSMSRKVIVSRDSPTVSSWILRPFVSAPNRLKIQRSLTRRTEAELRVSDCRLRGFEIQYCY